MSDSISQTIANRSEHGDARSWLTGQLSSSAAAHALMLGLAIFVCYFGLWNAYFITDDYWMLGWVRHHTSLGDAILAEFGYGIRFLLDAVLWVRVQLFDLNAAPYYWISLLQHAAVTLIVYWLAQSWTKRRSVAFLTALLFGTTFAHYEVITWITGSEYSLAAILYLSTLACFALYLQRRAIKWYIGALVAFVSLLIFLELSLSLPLILIAYHLTLGRAARSGRPIDWREIRLHVPFWILFAFYLVVQFGFVESGSSEAVVSSASYGPGLHIFPNLLKLVYLIVPDVHYGVLSAAIGQTGVQIVLVVTVVVAVVVTAVAIVGIWKGTALVRFALALVYLPFLPYTLWDSGFAGAIRYRYLPAIGFALLVALLLVRAHDELRSRGKTAHRRIVPAAVGVLVASNIVVVQIWVQRHVDNSVLRQAFVTELAADFLHVESGAQIFIEVPQQKYKDLKEACTLIFDRPVQCNSFLYGEVSSAEVADASSAGPVYWLRSTTSGIEQLFPPASEAQ